jgi:outer membrane protein OmpA-like peptidoglycan-associated protein
MTRKHGRRTSVGAAGILIRGAALLVAMLCGFATVAPAAAAPIRHDTTRHETARSSGSNSVPIAATFTYDAAQDSSQGVIHGAINAVVRIPGGTAVYYSLGGSADSYGAAMPSIGLHTPYNVFDAWSVGIVDPQGMKYYLPLVKSTAHCLCSRTADIGDLPGPKTPLVGYAVLPPLPARLKTVTVMFGFGNVLTDIPVTDQLPRPTATATPVKLGSGWPALPSKSTIDASDTSLAIRPMAKNTADPQAATKNSGKTTSVALNSSVLFAFDQATLTSAANGVLTGVADKISKSGAGTVTIVGYTDDVGDDSYNQTLSLQRAQAVQAALQKLVTASGVSFQASGMGEQSPVADNSTDAGRALNRRVTVTFTEGGK